VGGAEIVEENRLTEPGFRAAAPRGLRGDHGPDPDGWPEGVNQFTGAGIPCGASGRTPRSDRFACTSGGYREFGLPPLNLFKDVLRTHRRDAESGDLHPPCRAQAPHADRCRRHRARRPTGPRGCKNLLAGIWPTGSGRRAWGPIYDSELVFVTVPPPSIGTWSWPPARRHRRRVANGTSGRSGCFSCWNKMRAWSSMRRQSCRVDVGRRPTRGNARDSTSREPSEDRRVHLSGFCRFGWAVLVTAEVQNPERAADMGAAPLVFCRPGPAMGGTRTFRWIARADSSTWAEICRRLGRYAARHRGN